MLKTTASARPLAYRGKRLLDCAIVAAAAAPAIVVGAACAIAIALDSRGSVLFRQQRVGAREAEFEILKFRTMISAPEGDNPIFPQAAIITRSGRWLRRLSLDELPQLVNVARGDMSVVGPRPTLRYQVERYSDRQRLRLSVRPGLTGLAQVRGRNGLSWTERIELDLEYVAKQSLLLDCQILARTLVVLLRCRPVDNHPRDDPISVPAYGG